MKKISLIVLSFITIICCLCACGNSLSQNKDNKSSTSNKTTASDVSESGSKSSQGDTVVVPNVVGMNKDEAVKKLEGLGLIVETGYKHLQKDQQGNLYPDDEILEQSINTGTIVAPNTSISLTYNTNTEAYASEIKSDGTVNLSSLLLWRPDNDEILIPKYYDGKKVSSISTALLEIIEIREQTRTRKILIPKNVAIEENGVSIEDSKLNNYNIIRY